MDVDREEQSLNKTEGVGSSVFDCGACGSDAVGLLLMFVSGSPPVSQPESYLSVHVCVGVGCARLSTIPATHSL